MYDDPDGQPGHRPGAHRPGLRPAPEHEQRVGHVAGQEVAVDRLEADPLGVLDRGIRDVDRLGPPADEVEDRGQVGPDAEQRLGVVEGGRADLGLVEERRSRRSGRCPRRAPPRASSWRARPGCRAGGSHARATRIASRASRWASEKMPSSIFSWASVARTVARSGETSRGTSSTARRAASIAPAGSPAARRMTPRRPWSRPSWTRSARASSPPMAASRKLVARAVRPVAKAASEARTCRSTRSDGADRRWSPRAGRRRACPTATAPARARPARRRRRAARRRRRRPRWRRPGRPPGSWAASQWLTMTDGGPSRLIASAAWLRVRAIGRRSLAIARPIPSWRTAIPSSVSTRKPLRDGLLETGQQVRVEDAVARARAARPSAAPTGPCRSRRRRRGPPAAARSSGRSASAISRATRRHSTERMAIRATTRSSNEPVSELLGSSRRAARSSSATSGRPPDRSATRSSRLAEARSPWMPSISAASSSRSSGGRSSRVGGRGLGRDRGEVGQPRVVAPDDVRLERADDRQPLVARDPGQERDERPGRGVGPVEVLDDEQDRAVLAEPAEHAEDALQRPGLPSLRGGDARGRRSRRRSARAGRRGRAAGGTTSEAPEPSRSARTSSGSARRAGPMRPDDGAVRLVDAADGQAVARRTVIGWVRARIRTVASSRNRVTPTPAVPVDDHRPRRGRRRRRRGAPPGARTPHRGRRTARSCTWRAWPHSTGRVG